MATPGAFVPHTDEEIAEMLAFLGLSSLDELFSTVPEAIRLAGGLDLPSGQSEPDVAARMEQVASRNLATGTQLVCFAGGGAYDHEVPAAVRSLAGRSEFMTAYTPYQPEVAQGILQAVFEYQTMVTRLTGLDVANSSLYDGANALAEGVKLACGAAGKPKALVSQGVHPQWRSVLATVTRGTGIELELAPLEDGLTRWPATNAGAARGAGSGAGSGAGAEGVGALVLAYPNFLGCLEDVAAARRAADAAGALLVTCFDPVAAGLLRTVGEMGADVAVGEGQALGTALSFGGPYLGMFACRSEHVRRLPGRLVGETVDLDGRRAYVTTLRAREQDIRRAKATSNICTDQTLMAVTAAIQLGWLGTAGLRQVALGSARGARYCRESLLALGGVEPAATAPVLREFAVRAAVAGDVLVERLLDDGFLAGVPLGPGMEGSGCEGGLLVAVTERRTRAEIDAFVAAFDKAARS